MRKQKKLTLSSGVEIKISAETLDDFLSLTDMAKSQHKDAVIFKWMSLKSTLEYLGEWELRFLIIPNSV